MTHTHTHVLRQRSFEHVSAVRGSGASPRTRLDTRSRSLWIPEVCNFTRSTYKEDNATHLTKAATGKGSRESWAGKGGSFHGKLAICQFLCPDHAREPAMHSDFTLWVKCMMLLSEYDSSMIMASRIDKTRQPIT